MTSCNHHPTRRSPTLMRFGNVPFFSSLKMCCGVYGTRRRNSRLVILEEVVIRGSASSLYQPGSLLNPPFFYAST